MNRYPRIPLHGRADPPGRPGRIAEGERRAIRHWGRRRVPQTALAFIIRHDSIFFTRRLIRVVAIFAIDRYLDRNPC
jgi:hypothetical protein